MHKQWHKRIVVKEAVTLFLHTIVVATTFATVFDAAAAAAATATESKDTRTRLKQADYSRVLACALDGGVRDLCDCFVVTRPHAQISETLPHVVVTAHYHLFNRLWRYIDALALTYASQTCSG